MSKSKTYRCGELLEDRAIYDRTGAILLEGRYWKCGGCGRCLEVLAECSCASKE